MPVTPIKPLTLTYMAMEEARTGGGEAGPGPLRARRMAAEDQVQLSAQGRALSRAAAEPPPAEADRSAPTPGRSLNLLA